MRADSLPTLYTLYQQPDFCIIVPESPELYLSDTRNHHFTSGGGQIDGKHTRTEAGTCDARRDCNVPQYDLDHNQQIHIESFCFPIQRP